jgi:hypothetical protein
MARRSVPRSTRLIGCVRISKRQRIALGRCHESATKSSTYRPSSSIRCGMEMNDMELDDEIHSSVTTGGRSYLAMNEAFCTRMHAAIAAGMETAPIGVITTPGTKNPKYIPTEPAPLASALGGMEF